MNKKLPEDFAKKRLYNKNYQDFDKEVIRWEVLRIKKEQKIKVRFISCNSINRQGIRLAIDVGKGELTTNNVSVKAFTLWMDNSPKEQIIDCISEEGYLSVYNIHYRTEGFGQGKHSQMPYSGMLLEQNGNIYRYRCNDTGYKTEFDSLVFEIELL